MQTYKIIYDEQALDDLVDILEYYFEQGGFHLVNSIKERIKNSIQTLSTMPSRCVNSMLEPEFKQFSIERLPYRAYFLIDDNEKKVFIVRILHTSRNQKKLLQGYKNRKTPSN